MACVNCAKIRAAILHGRMAEAAGITVDVLREKIGLKADSPEPVAPVLVVGEQAPEPFPAERKAAKGK